MSYGSVNDLKARLGETRPVSDALCAMALASSDSAINLYCGRHFRPATGQATLRRYKMTNEEVLSVDDIGSVTGLVVSIAGSTWSAGQYRLEPTNGIRRGEVWPYTSVQALAPGYFPTWYAQRGYVADQGYASITADWGWPATPDLVRLAAIMLAAELFKRKDVPLGEGAEGAYISLRAPGAGFIRELLRDYVCDVGSAA